MIDLNVDRSLVREGKEVPQTLEEWVETAKAQILTEICCLEDRITSLKELFRRIEDITSYDLCLAVFKGTMAHDYYSPRDFPVLMELADNYKYIKAGTY